MNSKRLFIVLIVVVMLLCGGLIGGAYFANTMLQKYSLQVVKKRATILKLEQDKESLARAKRDIEKYRELATIARSIVPQDKDQAQTVQEIVNIAEANGIKLGSIAFPNSSLGEIKAPTTAGSTAKPTATSNAALSQLTPVTDIAGVYSLQINVASDAQQPVSYNRFINFLDNLEHNRRTALVSNITITPDKANRNNLSFTLTLDEYVKP